VRLTPRDPDVIWAAGRALVSRADTGVRVAVAFEHQTNDALALRVEVANDTDGRIEVGPRDVSYATCKSTAAASCAPAAWVIDPETMLDALQVEHSLWVAQTQNAAAMGGALTLLGAAGDVAAAGSGHPESAHTTAAALDVAATTSGRNASTLGRIEGEQARWADAFRRNTLFPGQAAGGPVYIPIVPDARLVWLQVQVGQRKFLFCFEQETKQVSLVTDGGPSDPWGGGGAPLR
jgi:hypothetical protein